MSQATIGVQVMFEHLGDTEDEVMVTDTLDVNTGECEEEPCHRCYPHPGYSRLLHKPGLYPVTLQK